MIGVLALQGGYERHGKVLEKLGVAYRYVKLPHQLEGLDGLIMPGGESTTMLKLANTFSLMEPLRACIQTGLPVFATCAGSILLCDTVLHPSQQSLGVLPATIERNAYGSQRESFYAEIDVEPWGLEQVGVYFIRAPRFVAHEPQVQVLCRFNQDIIGVQWRHITAVTFHTELADHTVMHRAWLHQQALV